MAFAKVAKEKCSVDMNRLCHVSDYAYVVSESPNWVFFFELIILHLKIAKSLTPG